MPEKHSTPEEISRGLLYLTAFFQIAFVAAVGVYLASILVFVCITGDLPSPTSIENPHVPYFIDHNDN